MMAGALRGRYVRDYDLTFAVTAAEADERLREYGTTGVDVLLVLVHKSIGEGGVLERARVLHPHARRGMLLDWNESRVRREEIAAAFAHRHAECFVTKPVASPDERFHRSVTELLDEWWRMRAIPVAAVQIIGADRSPRVSEICDVLQRHDVPYAFHTSESPTGRARLSTQASTRGRRP
jgi:thioredoxin reductase (NADPH)